MIIGCYFINDYWWIFYWWVIIGFSTGGYWGLLMDIMLVAIGGYFINVYWWIFC
jgi:hypothetical protein